MSIILSFILIVLSLSMVLDWFTSFFGILGSVGIEDFTSFDNIDKLFFVFLALVISVFVLILNLLSIDILELKDSFMKNFNTFFLKLVLKIITVLALLYDAITSYFGIARFVLHNKPSEGGIFPLIDFKVIFSDLNLTDQFIICLPFTIFLVLSPILFYNILIYTLKSQQE